MRKKKVKEKAGCNNVMAYHVATTSLSSYSSDKFTLSLQRRRKGTKSKREIVIIFIFVVISSSRRYSIK
jgi:hypothetical protein